MADDPVTTPPHHRRQGRSASESPAGDAWLDGAAATAHGAGPADGSVDPGADLTTRFASVPTAGGVSPGSMICPFLRASVTTDGAATLGPPVVVPDPSNRCAALAEAVPQSLRQQELVCLTGAYRNCPRYLRGSLMIGEPVVAAPQPGRTTRTLSPAILGSVAVLVAAFAASIAFVGARGGLTIEPFETSGPSPTAAAVVPGTASPAPTEDATAAPTPEPTDAPTPSPTPETTPTPLPTATPAPTSRPTPTPLPTSDRYQLLEPCPDASDCWIYTVRSGDNLTSIANYFGVPLEAVYDRNPWARTTPLRAGQELRLPPPTR